jgi:N-acetylneuraminic acid mutarotase
MTHIDHHELESVQRRFEETVLREKSRVDSDLLRLTTIFTKAVHETRNRIFQNYDRQFATFRENVEFIRHAETNRPANYASLVEKVRASPEIFTRKNQESYNTLYANFEAALQNIANQYQPRTIKPFNLKRGAGEGLEVNLNNYFQTGVAPTAHYFQPDTKSLSVAELPSGTFRHVELDIPFTIPAYHGSVVIPDGRIFLIGGINADNSESRKTYLYDPHHKTLVQKNDMSTPRFAFSLTYNKGRIYVFGGINQSGFLSSCEVYDVAADRWTSAAPMKVAVAHPSVCVFKGRYIYKFGGYATKTTLTNTIEKYSIVDDTWTAVNTPSDAKFTVFPLAAAAQINANQILVFGGINNDRKGTTGNTILTIDANGHETVSTADSLNLPLAESFWNQQTLVHQNRLYALQNATNPQGNVSGRKLLSFSEKKWNTL